MMMFFFSSHFINIVGIQTPVTAPSQTQSVIVTLKWGSANYWAFIQANVVTGCCVEYHSQVHELCPVFGSQLGIKSSSSFLGFFSIHNFAGISSPLMEKSLGSLMLYEAPHNIIDTKCFCMCMFLAPLEIHHVSYKETWQIYINRNVIL